jgi:hypothetical protein
MKRTFTLFTLLFIFCAFGFGQSPLNHVSSTLGGSTYEVCFYDNLVFAGCANTFRVYELDGPNDKPETIVYEERFISNIDQILVHGDHLYLCVNRAGLYKYDISTPSNPEYVTHYEPSSIDESIYDVDFYGDSLLVAAKTSLLVLEDAGGSINYVDTYASYPSPARIRGLDVKDDFLAYTVAYSIFSADDGVYLVDLTTMTEEDYFADNAGDPVEVYFGQSNELLHVMGGQLPATLFNGRYYALDYSVPSSLNMVYADTIEGQILAGGSVAIPMSAFILNDTVYVSTQGGGPQGWSLPTPYTGQIHIYDATDASDITYLADVYAGLYHFDADINPTNRKMYVASEWYGILTVDISDIYNDIDYGKTWTGGWCHGSAQAQNRLIEANEGFGVRLFDVTDKANPSLIAEDTLVGFCRAVALDDDADYAYCFYLTGDRFRVYDANTLDQVATQDIDPGVLFIGNFQNARYHNGRIAVMEEVSAFNKKITVMDVNDPLSPEVEHIRQKNTIEHLLWLSDGNLLACAKDSLLIFDPETMNVLDGYESPLGQEFKAVAESEDTLYVFASGGAEGIMTFNYSPTTESLTFLSTSAYTMQSNDRILMATDDTLLYITSSVDSLKALTISAPHNVVASYNHGADFVFDHLWGVQDLYYQDGLLYLNEYMGQTSIFTTSSLISGIEEKQFSQALEVYPNPSKGQFQIILAESGKLNVFNANGQQIITQNVQEGILNLDMSRQNTGVYFLIVQSENTIFHQKLIIQ